MTTGHRRDWDLVVVGLGALGSGAAWVLARAGARVLGLEQFALGHHRGRRTITRGSFAARTTRPGTCAWPAWPMRPGPSWSGRPRSGWWSPPAVSTCSRPDRPSRPAPTGPAWTGDLLAQLGTDLPLVVTQEQFTYFRPADPDAFAVGRFPVWIWMDDPSFYGLPVWPGGALKAAQDVGGPEVTATTRGFDPDPAATARLAGFLQTRLPAAVGTHDHTATCLYTLTPDRDLALGRLPGHDRVLVALGAAHGFKFAPLVGRVLADLALHGGTDVDITPFALGRPALTTLDPQANYLV